MEKVFSLICFFLVLSTKLHICVIIVHIKELATLGKMSSVLTGMHHEKVIFIMAK